jgi:hypothetical protein
MEPTQTKRITLHGIRGRNWSGLAKLDPACKHSSIERSVLNHLRLEPNANGTYDVELSFMGGSRKVVRTARFVRVEDTNAMVMIWDYYPVVFGP